MQSPRKGRRMENGAKQGEKEHEPTGKRGDGRKERCVLKEEEEQAEDHVFPEGAAEKKTLR
jgi:hypothetical protein